MGEAATQRKRHLEKEKQKHQEKLSPETEAENRMRLEERRDNKKKTLK